MKRPKFETAGVFFMVVVVLVLSFHTAVADTAPPAEPDGYRTENYNAPVPRTLKGVKGVLTSDGAKALQDQGVILIDVHPHPPKPANLPASTIWRDPPHRSVAGAIWLPNVGYGNLSVAMLQYFQTQLVALTAGDINKPLIFFCLRDCWMSWNASKRALELGYTQIYWFSEGTDSWEENGYPLAFVTPAQ